MSLCSLGSCFCNSPSVAVFRLECRTHLLCCDIRTRSKNTSSRSRPVSGSTVFLFVASLGHLGGEGCHDE